MFRGSYKRIYTFILVVEILITITSQHSPPRVALRVWVSVVVVVVVFSNGSNG